MDEVLPADQVFVMSHGKVTMNGTPKEVFHQVEELKKLGLEVPFATELAYELRKEGIDLSHDIISKEELVEELCRYV